jgi:hypothetical protein
MVDIDDTPDSEETDGQFSTAARSLHIADAPEV